MNVKFWLYLIFLVPSLLCSLFVLYHLLFTRTLRNAPNNHVIIVLLIIGLASQVTVYPWMLYYFRSDGVWDRTLIFCTVWSFMDWGLYVTQTILFAWATLERHILIFHDSWTSTKVKRCLIHYLPLALLLLYCLTFYVVIDFFPACENFYLDFDMVCVYLCSYGTYELYMWQTIVHQILPTFAIVLFSLTLLGRVLWRKYRMHQPIQWRKHRKMAVQLLSISLLYLVFSFPFILVTLMYLCGLSYSAYGTFIPYADFCSYFIILLLPFVCALSLPELQTKIKAIFRLRAPHGRAIHPTIGGRPVA